MGHLLMPKAIFISRKGAKNAKESPSDLGVLGAFA
jgi:hypothetical protein